LPTHWYSRHQQFKHHCLTMQIYSKKTEISKKLRENLREIIYNIPTYVASRHTTISYQRCYYKAPQHYYHEHHHNNLITNRPVLVILTYSPTVTLQFSLKNTLPKLETNYLTLKFFEVSIDVSSICPLRLMDTLLPSRNTNFNVQPLHDYEILAH
jgi:hypothetical protein